MLRNLLLIIMASVIVWSCGGQQTANQEQVAEEEVVTKVEPKAVTLAEFKEQAETLVGKEVILEGTIIHVCKHGGQKMFITEDDPDIRVKITPGEEMAAFETELVGEGTHAEEGEEHEEDADHTNHYHKPQYSVKAMKYTVVEVTPEEK